MKRATITIPDDLESRLDAYAQRQEVPPSLADVVQDALMEYLEKRERRPLTLTPLEEKDDAGEHDVSIEHDKYLAEATSKDKFNRR